MKPVSAQYFETLAQSRRVKPRSERKTILQKLLSDLLVRQLKIENQTKRKECRL